MNTYETPRDSQPSPPSSDPTIRPITGMERSLVRGHLRALGPEGLSLRFCAPPTLNLVDRHVQGINLNRDIALGLFVDGQLRGFVHGSSYAEDGLPVTRIGISVEASLRGRGWGGQLLDAALERAKRMGSTKAIVRTLAGNQAMERILARRSGAGLIHDGELLAEFSLSAPSEDHRMDHSVVDGIEVIAKTVHKGAPTALLVHGAGGDAWQWRKEVMPELARMGVNSVAISLPNHGESRPMDYLFEEHLRLIERWHIAAGPHAALAAHSMGGLLAQHHLARTGSRAPTALVSSLPPFDPEASPEASSPIDHVASQLSCSQARAHLRGLVGSVEKLDISRVKAPLTFVAGTRDKVVPLAWQQRAATAYNAPLRTLGGGHNLMLGSCGPALAQLVADLAREAAPTKSQAADLAPGKRTPGP